MEKFIGIALIVSLTAAGGVFAADKAPLTENKNVTVVQAASTVDGKSEISEKLLEECIVSLPQVEDLDAEVTSQVAFMKEINGDPNKNDFVKSYHAVIEINYMLHQQSLIIVATSSIQGQEPVMKVVEKTLRQIKLFESNPSEGEYYAGRSLRQYYFPTAEAAISDVKRRVGIWIKQQSAVVCKPQAAAKKNQ
jgi:selenocysteine-specific translation elongation factor